MSDWQEKKARIGRYYAGLIRTHGVDPRACDYGRPESQQAKFRVLSEVLPLGGASVLDVGCGFADYHAFLRSRYGTLSYTGVDLSQEMADIAASRHPDARIRRLDILEEDPGGPFDLVTANGIFYLLGEGAEEYTQRLIRRMFALCRQAVAFNSLSAWAPDPEPEEYYADPAAMTTFCRTLTPWVVMRHDYHPRDFTVYLYRQSRA